MAGHANLMPGSKVEPVLEAMMRASAGLRGIRHITAWDADPQVRNPGNPADPGMLADATFREGFKVLTRMGHSFDAWLYHPQIDELASLARAFPDAPIVLNHVGGPLGIAAYAGQRKEVFSRWAAPINALAACRNVCIQLGDLASLLVSSRCHEH